MKDIQIRRAREFAALHVPGEPLILYNAWDVGSAKAVQDAGARAIGTGSWSVAAANGYDDGEKIPLDLVLGIIGRIASAVDLPVTLDFEGGYARGGRELEDNVTRVIAAGAIGINFEDQRVADGSLFSAQEQAARIASIRRAAEESGIPLFINARTDVFLKNEVSRHGAFVDEAISRGKAYATAGASGLFVPGIRDEALIARVCRESGLPVNVLYYPELPPANRLAELGVARVSYGPRPYRETMARLMAEAKNAIG